MTLPAPPLSRYHPVAMALHWLLGLALVGLFAVGLYMVDLPFSPQRLKLYNWHKWAGVVVLALSFLRLGWRWWQPPPALPAAIAQAMPAWQRLAHHGTHLGLYLAFFAVPLLGWAYSSAAGFPVVLFGVWPLPDLVAAEPALAEALKPWHGWAAYALAGLVVLHVAGALKHAWVDRDGLLARMGLGRA
ncbi:cytochrome b [Aquabacterium sp. A08]|uniref:cytochrome b n=1 Tax=Aquabacterium sp. A08 TaxID=2718532 RepID=UPI001423EEAB|nr:cytochrome b [Aquabacterium sp. A08]NIC43725.1 cytochrome b [Aquabacterium sp. A08]